MRQVKILIEKHADGYVAYPVGLKDVVVGQGDTYEEALADVKSAIRFHLDTFGPEQLEADPPVLEIFVAEAGSTPDGRVPRGPTAEGRVHSSWIVLRGEDFPRLTTCYAL